MTALRALPLDELKKVSEANSGLLEAVRSLSDLARTTEDPALRESLRRQIERILDGSDAINRAIQSSVPVPE